MPTPNLRLRAVVPAFLGACLLAFTMSAPAEAKTAKTVPAQLRVYDSDGNAIAEQTQYTGSVGIKTDKHADCFGAGTGGSGDTVTLDDPNALGLLSDGAVADPLLKPLSVTDSFDFGLGLCGIGKAVAPTTGFWYLKQNHVGSQTGGDQTIVKKGDDIVWYLIDDFNDPTPDELVLSAPSKVKQGDAIKVKVVSYADDGKKTPAKGADVTGADKPTDAKGETTVDADEDVLGLTATRNGSIPSNTEVICTLPASQCSPGFQTTIGGTDAADKIVGTDEAETILAGGGDDKVDASEGAYPDLVNCGGGKDVVTLAKRQKNTETRSCERVIRH
jgi:hypothetical protein